MLGDQATEVATKLAVSYGANVFEKDRDNMRFLTDGQEAFFVAYYFEDRNAPVMWITNVGAGDRLTLAATSGHEFTKNDARSLVDAVRTALLVDLGIELSRTDPNPDAAH